MLYISTQFPQNISLDIDEAWRINRIRVAQYLHCMPAEVDSMPASDYEDVLEVIWADEQIARARRQKTS